MTHLERAENMSEIIKSADASQNIKDAAYDAIQAFVSAKEAHKANNRAEAALQHRRGVKFFEVARKWHADCGQVNL